MSRAEERALEAYPDSTRDELGILTFWGYSQRYRDCFIEGYEQAEKDIAPLIEAAMIVYEAWNGGTMDDVRRGMVELGKRFNEAKK